MSEIVKAYNDKALELSKQKPWTGARATGFRTDKNNNRGFIFLAMNLDKKANIADEVPVEFMTSIINQGNGKLTGGELFFPDVIPAAESEWGFKVNLLLVNSVIHTNSKDANRKFIDLAFTSITTPDFAFGTGGVENRYPLMSNSFGHNRPFTAMPMFNFGSLFGDQFGGGMTLYADQQKIFFISPNRTKKRNDNGRGKDNNRRGF